MTEVRIKEIVRLLDEIDRETYGKNRQIRIVNLTRRIRLEIRKSRKTNNGKNLSAQNRACQ